MIPQRLNVGTSVIEIQLVENLTDEKGRSICGCFSPSARTIRLNSTLLTGMELADTLLHEAIHALFYVHGWCTFEALTEENVASLLGTGLTLLFRDNPELPVSLLGLTALGQKKVRLALDIKHGLN